ncbi:MAG: hypothetical protein ACOY90_20220 [Candidatus Zhuqueibacterota bacterium]
MDKKLLELLYRSIDSVLSESERQKLDQALRESASLRAEKKALLKMRSHLLPEQPVKFKPYFADRVMNRINARKTPAVVQDTYFDSLLALVKPVAIALVIILISLLTYNLKSTKNYTLAGAMGQELAQLEHAIDPAYLIETE